VHALAREKNEREREREREESREEEWVKRAIVIYITRVGVDNGRGQIFRSSNGSHRVSQIIMVSLEYSIFIIVRKLDIDPFD
jgi:hypothetical protein